MTKPKYALDSVRFEMRTTEAWLRRLDDWRRERDNIPSRSEAIRRLVEAALDAEKKTKPKG
jgi:metal-responsive CopG/Arc/MetJ family transcriptional regulator